MNCFSDGVEGAIRMRNARDGFHQDVVLLSDPRAIVSPADAGLDAATTVVEVWSEILAGPALVRTARELANGLADEDVQISEAMSFGMGEAFQLEEEAETRLAVGKGVVEVADDAGVPVHGGCNSRDEAAAPDRHDDRLDAGQVLEHLEPDGALAGDRARRVERMDEGPPRLGEQQVEAAERLARVGGLEVDGGAVAARGGDLRLARALPHHEERVELFLRRAPRDRLGVVTGRDRDDAARLLLVRERGEVVEHAARLERARALEQLGLEEHLRAERPAGQERRAQEAAADDFRRALDVSPFDH